MKIPQEVANFRLSPIFAPFGLLYGDNSADVNYCLGNNDDIATEHPETPPNALGCPQDLFPELRLAFAMDSHQRMASRSIVAFALWTLFDNLQRLM
jgi:hypothetical protein